MTLVYLASPYSHDDPQVMEGRFTAVCQVAAQIMAEGIHVYSPIAHTHPIAMVGDLPKHWEYWAEYDRVMIAACDQLWVAMIDGWKDSRGVAAEIEIARCMGKPVDYLTVEDCEAQA
jgi:nucleoside 2-deoxyribosyltransferase